jgi:RNA polymerase sigma factor (sigma-70 family)
VTKRNGIGKGNRIARRNQPADMPPALDKQHQDFAAIYERHNREVWRVGYNRLKNAEKAMDVTQETFLQLWRQFLAGEKIDNYAAWLLRVAHNVAEDHARRGVHRDPTLRPEIIDASPANGPTPLESLIRVENRQRLDDALAKLPEDLRIVIILRHEADFIFEEIGEELGISTSTAHFKYHRARAQLRQLLADLAAADMDERAS